MSHKFLPLTGAAAFQLSNPCVLAVVSLLSSLKVFEQTSMIDLFQKTRKLTSYMRTLLTALVPEVKILTPVNDSGAQLSLLCESSVFEKIFEELAGKGIICDKRKPNVIRVAAVPLYNSFKDVYLFVDTLKRTFEQTRNY